VPTSSLPARASATLGATLLVALAVGVLVVGDAERGERDFEAVLAKESPASDAWRVSAADRLTVEICASPAPAGGALIPILVEAPDATSSRAVVAVRNLGAASLALARRDAGGACWTAYEGRAPRAGSVRTRLADVVDVAGTTIVTRVSVRARTSAWSGAAALLVGLAALALALGFATAPLPAPSAGGRVTTRAASLGVLLLGGVLVAMASQGVRYIGGAHATGGIARGLLLALVEVGIAVVLATWLAHRSGVASSALLGLHRPRGGLRVLAASPVVGVVCALVATWLLRVVPSSPGEAPIVLFVARPSGALAFGVLALSAPIAEELFFRGFVQSAASRAVGPAASVVASASLFTLAHAQQAWGAWGGLAAVAWLGVALALLRATTGSSAATMLAHLVYNVVLTGPGLP
jgi:membrane protease YdiL (CAAX protease family)